MSNRRRWERGACGQRAGGQRWGGGAGEQEAWWAGGCGRRRGVESVNAWTKYKWFHTRCLLFNYLTCYYCYWLSIFSCTERRLAAGNNYGTAPAAMTDYMGLVTVTNQTCILMVCVHAHAGHGLLHYS